MDGDYEIMEMKRGSTDGQWWFTARPIPQKDVTFVCLYENTSMMIDEIWKLAMDCDSAGMAFDKMDGVGVVLKSIDTTRASNLQRYYIVKAEMKSPDNMTWHFTARPVPTSDVEFRCDECIEDEIWKLARDGVQVHLEFIKGLYGKNILIRCARSKT